VSNLDSRADTTVNPYDPPTAGDVELTTSHCLLHVDYPRLRRAMIGFMLTMIAMIIGIGAPMIAHSDNPYVEAAFLALYCLTPAIGVYAFWNNRTASDAQLTARRFRKAVIAGRQACVLCGACSVLAALLLRRFLPESFRDGSAPVLMACGAAFLICRLLCPRVPGIPGGVVERIER
jgi:hypothetical protein